jgi:tetratricopeptide (TPR) repeat protein
LSEESLRDLFDRATELAPEERTLWLRQACGEDAALLKEVQALLAADANAANETFWQHSALRNQVIAEGGDRSEIGEVIGHYRLVELIGKGGMGTVYRAERIDAAFDKSVAIKLINGVFHSADVISHFRAERQILANLEHPNIARLLDGGARADGLPYLIMEYVEGISPYDYCRERNLSVAERLVLFRQICSAVHFAHQNMVIHRDLKPANILVTPDGTPKLLDFGIAKVLNPDPLRSRDDLTEPGMLKLTARYASPEQIRGESVTTASDVYSLGVILYELLSGHSPYGDGDRAPHQLMSAVCDDEPAKPSVWLPNLKGDLDNIILRALRKPPLERYASADRFSEDILRHLEGLPVEARGDAPLYVAAKFVRRNRAGVATAALLLCSLVGGLVAVSLARARAERRFNELHQLAHSVVFDYSDAIDRLPGSTPVRERLVKDALTYLDSLSNEADTPELQREIVDAYVRISNVQGNEYQSNLGNTADALVSAQKATAAAEKMLKGERTIPVLDSAASAFSTDGSLLYSAGELSAADHAYQRALSLRKEIARQSPADVQNQIALATCLSHLGDLYGGNGFQNLGKTAESLAYHEQAKAVVTALSTKYPGNFDVAKESYETLLSMSSAEGVVGRHEDATRDLGDALAQIEKVSLAQPHDTNVRYELANGESRLGQMLIDGRDAPAAIPHLARSAGLIQVLLQDDTGNANFRRAESVVESQWAAALRGAGHASEGVAHNERALRLAEALSHDAPKSAQYRVDVGTSERKLADGLLAAGDAAGSLHHSQQATQILCNDENTQKDPNTLANCGRAQLAVGKAYLALHNAVAAESALRKAQEISTQQSLGDPVSAVFRSDSARSEAALAAALALAGNTQAARDTYERALNDWSMLRETKSISAEDAHRSEDAALALAALRPRK